MKPLLIATGNAGKHKELLTAFGGLSGWQLLSLKDFDPIPDTEESGTTFKENALLKAQYFGNAHKTPALGEDSGIILHALPDKFGVRTRREINASNDIEWLRIFLEMLEETKDRTATFTSAMAYWDPATGQQHLCTGSVTGQVTQFPQTPLEPGVPVSAVFIPDGADRVFSAMTKDQKNQQSHRGAAAAQMQIFLEAL